MSSLDLPAPPTKLGRTLGEMQAMMLWEGTDDSEVVVCKVAMNDITLLLS